MAKLKTIITSKSEKFLEEIFKQRLAYRDLSRQDRNYGWIISLRISMNILPTLTAVLLELLTLKQNIKW